MESEEEIIKNLKVFLKEVYETDDWSMGDMVDNLHDFYKKLKLEKWNPGE